MKTKKKKKKRIKIEVIIEKNKQGVACVMRISKRCILILIHCLSNTVPLLQKSCSFYLSPLHQQSNLSKGKIQSKHKPNNNWDWALSSPSSHFSFFICCFDIRMTRLNTLSHALVTLIFKVLLGGGRTGDRVNWLPI